MSLPRYPKYKDSGVEWLGEVPEHWRVRRLKHVCEAFPSNVDKKSHEGEQPVLLCNYTDVYYHDHITADMQFMSASASPDQIEKFTLRAGDTVITKDSETADDIAVSAYVPADLPGVVCGYHLSIVRPRAATSGAFVKRLFDSAYTRATVAVKANGLTRVGLSQYDIDNIEWPWPPPKEQAAIASFLDRETTKIDALIAEQQRLVALLKEKGKAVISHAVTKGLNPDAPMKPSGVEWLGDVPEHWSVAQMGARYSVQLGKMLNSSRVTGAHLRPYLRVADVQWGSINVDELPEMDFLAADRVKFKLSPGDLLVNEGGSYPGRSAVWSGSLAECYYQKALHRLRPLRPTADSPQYAYYLMRWAAEQGVFVAGGNETTIEHLPAERLRRYRFPFPPVEEQTAIVSHLNSVTACLDALAADAERAVQFLLERRSAVISAAVTGRIDTRISRTAETDRQQPYTTGFARQILAAEILTRCHSQRTTGRVKLQKLIHLCEHVAQIEEVRASYTRKAAGPFDNKVMFGIAKGLEQQRWFAEVKTPSRTSYRPLEKAGGHSPYLARWQDKMPQVNKVLDLLAQADTQQCEIVSTLYAAWNDFIIEGRHPSDDEVIREVCDPIRWHESKAKIPAAKWPAALAWMRAKGLVPTGFGAHTKLEPPSVPVAR